MGDFIAIVGNSDKSVVFCVIPSFTIVSSLAISFTFQCPLSGSYLLFKARNFDAPLFPTRPSIVGFLIVRTGVTSYLLQTRYRR